MAVLGIEQYKQKNSNDILKVILRPTQKFLQGYFYCDSCDEELVKSYTWCLLNQKQPYVVAIIGSHYRQQILFFHQEKAYNILGYHPDYINHIDGIEYDNVNMNLDKVTNQQNLWCRPSKGYFRDKRCRSFVPCVRVNSHIIYAKCVPTEVEACISAYQLEVTYEDYMYNFLRDRRKDTDILDLERTGQISEDEATYRHVLKYANNAWYYYRYNLADYFRCYHISVPAFSIDSDGFMIHSVTGQRLCPL